ncbi:putative nuclease HARBI1 [Ornithodoros turicata]|uniref:putative nuclease HARBI1 n=1 Tax=Ornithodoros turicata TaxID=34597 RepID=UPI003139EA03
MAELYAFIADVGICEEEVIRVFRPHVDALAALSDDQFVAHFRLSKDAVREVCSAVSDDLKRLQQWRSTTLSVEQRVLMALRFYATGAFLDTIAHEEYFSTTKRPVSEAIHDVSWAIIKNLAPRYLRFPTTPDEKLAVKRGFYDIKGLPGCLGAVDGTVIAIIAPSTRDPRFVDEESEVVAAENNSDLEETDDEDWETGNDPTSETAPLGSPTSPALQ